MFDLHQIDSQVPGQTYLCQVSDCVSCGSCCGLYNTPCSSRTELRSILLDRTQTFETVPRTIDSILEFETKRIAQEPGPAPIADFHHCMFIGLIQDEGERPGCLLHPLANGNNGIDLRGLSFYGGAACKHFFCPSYHLLPIRYKLIVRSLISDWYEYGMIITEAPYLALIFCEIESILGHDLDPHLKCIKSATSLAQLIRLRFNWPFRKQNTPLAHNFFSTRDYQRDKAKFHFTPPARIPYLALLAELDSEFETIKSLNKAQLLIQNLFSRTAAQLSYQP